LVGHNRTHTVCECTHLTHFAVLVSLDDEGGLDPDGDDDYVSMFADTSRRLALVEWLTSAAVALSIAGLAAAIVLTLMWRNCRVRKSVSCSYSETTDTTKMIDCCCPSFFLTILHLSIFIHFLILRSQVWINCMQIAMLKSNTFL
jgi:hypothetical protein